MSKKVNPFSQMGELVSQKLRETRNMKVYGLWNVFELRTSCVSEHTNNAVLLLTSDPIAFPLLVQLASLDDRKLPVSERNSIVFKEKHTKELFIRKLSQSNILIAAPESNYIATFIIDNANKLTKVYFMDLRKY